MRGLLVNSGRGEDGKQVSARRKSEFWNFSGSLVYITMTTPLCILSILTGELATALVCSAVSLIVPFVFVSAMGAWRHKQYMEELNGHRRVWK